MYLPLPATLIAFGICLGVFILAAWQSSKPARPEKGPRMIPWTLIAIMAGGIGVILIAHLMTFAGMEPQRPRRF